MHDTPIAQLVKLHRIDRRMSIVSLATRAGVTVRYLEMIEAGTKTPTIRVLRKLAEVLRVRVAALVSDEPSENRELPAGPRLTEVERALYAYGSLLPSGSDSGPPDSPDLTRRLDAARSAWFLSPNKYSETLDALPGLIVDAEHAVRAYSRSLEACQRAAEVYRLARFAFTHGGRTDLGGLVADRGMRHAEETGDPVLIAAAMWDIGNAMLHSDMPDMALDLAMRGAERLEPLLPDATPGVFTVYGHLLLLASLASVRNGDAKRGRQLLRGPAREAATKVGDDTQYHGVVFGPTNVAMYTVAVEAEAGETSEALRLADSVDIATIPSLERRTTHLYQVARCHERRGNDTAVLVHLQMAHKQCPEDFKYKHAARTMVHTLIRRARPSYAPEVRAFATTAGLLDR